MAENSVTFGKMSNDGLHEKVVELALPYLARNSILIAGAGQGALEHRLMGRGIKSEQIKALDIYPQQYRLDSVECTFCNLNHKIPYDDSSFDFVFCVEVIEHLENPQNIINEAYRVLRNGGYFMLTTPNVHSIMQKIRFLLTDQLIYFTEDAYRYIGHLHPIFDWQVKRMTRNYFKIMHYDSQSFHLRLIPHTPAIPIPFKHRLFASNNIYLMQKIGGA